MFTVPLYYVSFGHTTVTNVPINVMDGGVVIYKDEGNGAEMSYLMISDELRAIVPINIVMAKTTEIFGNIKQIALYLQYKSKNQRIWHYRQLQSEWRISLKTISTLFAINSVLATPLRTHCL